MNTTSLWFNPGAQLNVTLDDVHLIRGIASHLLRVHITVSPTKWPGLDGLDTIDGGHALLTGSASAASPLSGWLGELQTRVVPIRSSAMADLSISLSDEQMLALEDRSSYSGVTLMLDLQATVLSSFDGYPVATGQAQVIISEARWHELLDQARTEVGVAIRVQAPLADQHTATDRAGRAVSLGSAVRRLRQANDALRDARWRDCVSDCRRIVEIITQLAADVPTWESVKDKNPRTRTQPERWATVLYAVNSLASAAHHEEDVTAQFTWRRVDAEAALSATAGLLKLYLSERS